LFVVTSPKTLAAAWSAVISRPFGSAWLLSTPSPVTTGSHRFGRSSHAAMFNAIRRTWDTPVTTWPTWAPHRSKAARRSVPPNVCELSRPKPVLMRSSSAGRRSSCSDRWPSAPLLWEKPENDEVLERKKRRPSSGFSRLRTGPRVAASSCSSNARLRRGTPGQHLFGRTGHATIFNALRRSWDIPVRTRSTWAPHRSRAARRSARKSWRW
jgi:hypothetical protein